MLHKEFIVLIAVFGFGIATDIPSNFETCKRSDGDLNGCLKKAIEKVFPLLEKGIPELKFPTGQPLYVPSMSIGEGTGTVHVVQNYNNLSIYNFFRPNIEKVDAKFTDNGIDLTMDMFYPDVLVDGYYDFNGRILVLPIVGKGPLKIKFFDIKTQIVLHGEEIKKKGQAFYDIKDFKLILHPGKITFELENLFNGDKRLGDEMNKVLNENWQAIWGDVSEAYELTMGAIFHNLATIIFKKIPHNQIFKD